MKLLLSRPCTPAAAEAAYLMAWFGYAIACYVNHGVNEAYRVRDACEEARADACRAERRAMVAV